MFPDVDPKRVESLLVDPNFVSRHSLSDLVIEVERLKQDGQDVERIDKLPSTAYRPAMEALDVQIAKSGWNMSEVSAAHMVAEKTVTLP